MSRRDDGNETRAKLLRVAGKIFAEKGYDRAVHKEICELAEVNTSAINYYFRSKENMHQEAWLQAFRESLEKYPPDGGVPADAPADARLRGQVSALVHRIVDPDNIEFDIAYREMADSTQRLAPVIEKAMGPLHENLRSVISELLGPGVSDRELDFCAMGIVGQCFNPLTMHQHFKRRWGDRPESPLAIDFDVEVFIEHVFSFSLSGIKGVGERLAAARRKGVSSGGA